MGVGGLEGGLGKGGPPPPCDIPSGCCFFTGPWAVTRSSLRMLRRVAAFCRSLRPVLLLVSFPRSRSPVVGVLGLCWMWRDELERFLTSHNAKPNAFLNGEGTPERHTCFAVGCTGSADLLGSNGTHNCSGRSLFAGVQILHQGLMVDRPDPCAVCVSAAPNNWRIEDVLVVAGVV